VVIVAFVGLTLLLQYLAIVWRQQIAFCLLLLLLAGRVAKKLISRIYGL